MNEVKPKSRLGIVILVILLITLFAALAGGGYWYFKDKKYKEEQQAKEKQLQELQTKKATKIEEAKDETADWKLYTDHLNRFTVKYPNAWTYKEDVVQGSDGTLNSNVFSADNVLFYDAGKTMIFGYNLGEVLGRGGACTKRVVFYKPTVSSKKLTITKVTDTTTAVSADEYCGMGELLTGYQAGIESFTENGTDYFIHSEMASATDTTTATALDIFEKMAKTVTFK